MTVYINRSINMKKIKAIGFDMDYTIVRYNTEAFETFAFYEAIKKLVSIKGYPKEVLDFKFNFNHSLQGLIIDKKRGTLVKISRYGKVKTCSYGLKKLDFKEQQKIYRNQVVDLSAESTFSLDTAFSISNGVLFSNLVELKKSIPTLGDYQTLADDSREIIDLIHRDGTLKDEVAKNIKKYIIQDPALPPLLEKYKDAGKKLLVITNSDYHYCRLLLDYTITPFLKKHKHWSEIFDITITLSRKPHFFTTPSSYLAITPETGLMKNYEKPLADGIYQGGYAGRLQEDLGLDGDEILYLGDHIYGDVLTIKKTFKWRTALVLDPLRQEIDSLEKGKDIQLEIDILMEQKEDLEKQIDKLDEKKLSGKEVSKDNFHIIYSKIDTINSKVSELLGLYKSLFNPYWGEMMRAGQEESSFADQVEKYACIYMCKVEDLLSYSPTTYFRPKRRVLPHEIL